MNQHKILSLLHAAADLATDKPPEWYHRVNEIQVELGRAVFDDHEGQNGTLSRAAGFQVLLSHLFIKTIQNKPEHLPALFPFFAALCGDRDSMIVTSKIEWELMDE